MASDANNEGRLYRAPSRFLLALAHKLDLYRWMLLANGASLAAMVQAPPARKSVDAEQRTACCEELLSLLIQVVTELPRPPGGAALASELRREIVHRLAASPCSRSELAACVESCSRPKLARGNGGSTPTDAILASVAQPVPPPPTAAGFGVSRGAPKFTLKAAALCEYDPEFYHATPAQHKAVAERRAERRASSKATAPAAAPRPFVGAPPPAHPFFLRVRSLLFAPPLIGAVRSLLASALLRATPPSMLLAVPAATDGEADALRGAPSSLASRLGGRLLPSTPATAESSGTSESISSADGGGGPAIPSPPLPAGQLPTTPLVRAAALGIVWEHGGHADVVEQRKLGVEAAMKEGSEVLLARALHLLTLMVHVASDTSPEAPLPGGSPQRAAFFVRLCARSSLVEPPDEGSEIGEVDVSHRSEIDEVDVSHRSDPSLSGSICSVLELIRALSLGLEPTNPHREPCEWLVAALRRASEACAMELHGMDEADRAAQQQGGSAGEGSGAAEGGGGAAASRLEKKKRAQQRMMAQMKQQSAKFVEFLADAEGGGEPSSPSALSPVVSQSAAAATSAFAADSSGAHSPPRLMDAKVLESLTMGAWPAEPPMCIICHNEDEKPIGFVCCAQPSAVLRRALPRSNGSWAGKRLAGEALHFCGHAVHAECLAT